MSTKHNDLSSYFNACTEEELFIIERFSECSEALNLDACLKYNTLFYSYQNKNICYFNRSKGVFYISFLYGTQFVDAYQILVQEHRKQAKICPITSLEHFHTLEEAVLNYVKASIARVSFK